MDSSREGGVPAYDVMGPEMASNPQPIYKLMREHEPIAKSEFATTLTRRADVDHALRHPEIFSSNMGAIDLGNTRPLIPLQIDPPDHVKYRRLLDPLFAPKQMAALEPEVTALVNTLIDGFIDRGECDFNNDFAVPLPSQVFLTLLGLPLDDLDTFLGWKDGIIRPPMDDDFGQAARHRAGAEIESYFDGALTAAEAKPGDDLLSWMLEAEMDGHRLSRDEMIGTLFLFMIAGLDTVTCTLDCSVAYLAQHPDQRARLANDLSLVPTTVEELLRWETPVPGVVRVAAQDTEIGGCPVHKGEIVSVLIGSANTDEDDLPDAYDVDLGRQENRHLAFGGGIHRCLGSHLARLGVAGRVARVASPHPRVLGEGQHRAGVHTGPARHRALPARVFRVKVVLDANACTGHGRCYMLAPDVFAPDERGHCEVRIADVPDALVAQATLAVSNCPERALSTDDHAE